MVEAVPAGVMRLRRRALSAAAGAALVALALRAPATVVVAKDFAALCDEADAIFVGTVTGVESRWSDPTKQSIETLVTFGDLTWLRGAPQSTVTLRFGGGEVDGVHEAIAGVPQFAIGDRRVIFTHDGTFVSPIVGFDQGALPVVDRAGTPVVLGAESVSGTRGALRLGAPTTADTAPMPLDELLGRIRRQLAAPRSGTP